MTARAVIITGFIVLLVLVLAAIVVSHLRRDRLSTLSQTLRQLTRTRAATIVAVVIWAWLGWHFLAR